MPEFSQKLFWHACLCPGAQPEGEFVEYGQEFFVYSNRALQVAGSAKFVSHGLQLAAKLCQKGLDRRRLRGCRQTTAQYLQARRIEQFGKSLPEVRIFEMQSFPVKICRRLSLQPVVQGPPGAVFVCEGVKVTEHQVLIAV